MKTLNQENRRARTAKTTKKLIGFIVGYALLTLLALFMTGPFLWMLSSSLMPGKNVFTFPPTFLPTFIDFKNYVEVWQSMDFPLYIWNTFVITILGVAANILLACSAAYPLAKMQFKGRGLVFSFLIATMIIPSSTAIIVHYLTIRDFGLLNTFAGVILPSAASVFNIFLMRQTFMSVPDELRASGKIDGASEFRIWWQLMLPLVKPGIAVIALLECMNYWNNFIWPIVALSDPKKYPIAAALTFLNGQFSYNFGWIAAGTIISIIPIVIVFLFTQKYYMQGLGGAIKG